MAKETKDIKVMSATFKRHAYCKGMLIFRSQSDAEMHRYPNPTKETFVSLGNGEFGKVESFFVLTEDGISHAESYNINDLGNYIATKFKVTIVK